MGVLVITDTAMPYAMYGEDIRGRGASHSPEDDGALRAMPDLIGAERGLRAGAASALALHDQDSGSKP